MVANKYIKQSWNIVCQPCCLSFTMQLEIVSINTLFWKIFLGNICTCSHKSSSWCYILTVDVKLEVVFAESYHVAIFSFSSFPPCNWKNIWSKWDFEIYLKLWVGKNGEAEEEPPILESDKSHKDDNPQLKTQWHHIFSFLEKGVREQTWFSFFFFFFHFTLKEPQTFKGPGPITYSSSFTTEWFLWFWTWICVLTPATADLNQES